MASLAGTSPHMKDEAGPEPAAASRLAPGVIPQTATHSLSIGETSI
jgi:hypothetical protein